MNKKNTNQGFSLIELMITIGILGIIAAIAIPQYLGYVENSKRQIALNTLEQFPLLLEGYRAENGIMCPDCRCNTTKRHTHTYTMAQIKKHYPDFHASKKTTEASPYDYSLSVTVKKDCTCNATFTATPTTEGKKQGYPEYMPTNGDNQPKLIKGNYTE